jgi:hypothetical protein
VYSVGRDRSERISRPRDRVYKVTIRLGISNQELLKLKEKL